jgi:undecaprenyl diphosphate synthase
MSNHPPDLMSTPTSQVENPAPAEPAEGAVPRHIAVIMDGNGRWAQQRGLPRLSGHRAGTENIRRIIESCVEAGVEVLTLYAFSTENWRRPGEEVKGLMVILGDVIERETAKLHENGVQLRHIGSLDGVPARLRERVRHAIELTRSNSRLVLNIAFNYGGRAELVDAVRRIVATGVPAAAIDEELISSNLQTAGLPDPDLIIRTAGEQRVSNFLLWQGAYAEFWSTPVYWPDFDGAELERAISDYGQRHRRFGSL